MLDLERCINVVPLDEMTSNCYKVLTRICIIVDCVSDCFSTDYAVSNHFVLQFLLRFHPQKRFMSLLSPLIDVDLIVIWYVMAILPTEITLLLSSSWSFVEAFVVLQRGRHLLFSIDIYVSVVPH